MTGIPVMNISNFYKRILLKSGDYSQFFFFWTGICQDKTIIEVKTRIINFSTIYENMRKSKLFLYVHFENLLNLSGLKLI